MLDEMLVDNSARRKRQKALDIRVIIGNPPYSAGQESANDNNANIEYPHLDARIRQNLRRTLQCHIKKCPIRQLHPCHPLGIRPHRGAGSYRLRNQCRLGRSQYRRRIAQMFGRRIFEPVYLPPARQPTHISERSRKEGGKIFGSGSRAPIAISILVKTRRRRNKDRFTSTTSATT